MEIVVTQTATSPTLLVLDLSPQLLLGPQTWHIVLFLLKKSMTSIYIADYHVSKVLDGYVLYLLQVSFALLCERVNEVLHFTLLHILIYL